MLNHNDIQLLEKIADLCNEASDTIFETNENAHILNACDELMVLIDDYVEQVKDEQE